MFLQAEGREAAARTRLGSLGRLVANHRGAFLEGVESSRSPRPGRREWNFPEAYFRLAPTRESSTVSIVSNVRITLGPLDLGANILFSRFLGAKQFTEVVGF